MLRPVLTPIYGAVGTLKYPTKPLSITAQVRNTSILTFVKNKRPDSNEDVVREGLMIQVPVVHYNQIGGSARRELRGVSESERK